MPKGIDEYAATRVDENIPKLTADQMEQYLIGTIVRKN